MKFLSPLFAILLVCFLFSCKKNSKEKSEQKDLPNFGNVKFSQILSNEDQQIPNEDSVKTFLQHYYKSVWENGNLSGGILVAKGDKILLEEYRGFAQEFDEEPIVSNTPLHVASVSKTLTAMAVMKLVEADSIKLTDPVTKFFPKFPYPQVQLIHLLNQRSGLPKYEYFIEKITPAPAELSKKFLTNQDILNMLIRYKPELSKETNTGFMYCNTNYALLALIVEHCTKLSFPEAMNAIVFNPLKMKNSYIFTEADTLKAAKSFYFRGNRLYPYDRLDLIYGDKNVYTTPRDLYQFSKAMFSPDFLRADLMQMVFTPYSNEKPGVNNYGLGFRMKIFDNGEKLTYHNGWWHGTNSVFAHLLKSKVTIIAIGNKYSNRVYSALALSGLFENFPYETEKLQKTLTGEDSVKVDSTATSGE